MKVDKKVIIEMTGNEALMLKKFIEYNQECDDNFDSSTEDNRRANEFAKKLMTVL